MSEYYAPEPTVIEYLDTDGDGCEETTLLDTDGDGYADTALVDVDYDGQADVAGFDNRPDAEFTADVVSVDLDGDGIADETYDDVDYDGVFDTVDHVATPLADSNPYGPYSPEYTGGTGEGEETYAPPVEESSDEGAVLFGEGGDALTTLPGGEISFSGTDVSGTDFSATTG